MDTFEQAFSDTERAAEATLRAAANLSSPLKALQKAAQRGNIAAIKRAQSSIEAALTHLSQEVKNAYSAWPYQDDEVKQDLETRYLDELRQQTQSKGLQAHERDGLLIAHPSIVRVLPGERAVRVDRKQTSDIRPSHLAGLLLANQRKPVRHQSAFLEALYDVYSDFLREESPDRLVKGSAPVVPLETIYRRLTYLPGSSREFDRGDFARAVYTLDAGVDKRTRSGATVSFHASTGTKSTKGVFTFIGLDGRDVQYYGVRFTKAS